MFGLPVPRPDELMYSVIARYIRSWGYLNQPRLLNGVLGGKRPSISMCFCNCCDSISKASLSNPLVSVDILQRHTVLPYYLALQPPTVTAAFRKIIAGNPTNGADIRQLVRSIHVTTASPLRFCQECYETDMQRYGDSYWRRSHQLPGVLLCPEHCCLLYDSDVAPGDGPAVRYFPVSPLFCHAMNANLVKTRISRKALNYITAHSVSLLNVTLGRTSYVSPEGYKKILRDAGYRVRKNVTATRVREDFERFHRKHRLEDLQTRKSTLHNSIWNLHQHCAHALRPLDHILFRMFLEHAQSSNADSVKAARTTALNGK